MIGCIRCKHEIHSGFCQKDGKCGCDRDGFNELLEYVEELEVKLAALKDDLTQLELQNLRDS